MSKIKRELWIVFLLGVSLVLGSLCTDLVLVPQRDSADADLGQAPVEAVASAQPPSAP